MKNKKDEQSAPKEAELVVIQEDYEAGLKRGWTADDMLKPGRYKLKRGGFLARHPELKIKEKKRDGTLKAFDMIAQGPARRATAWEPDATHDIARDPSRVTRA